MADPKNTLHYGDNLDVLQRYVKDESVDLIYLDPPFNSNRSYNVLFKTKSGDDAQAQIEAFDDTWTWSQQSEAEYDELTQGGAPPKVADAIEAMRKLLGDNDVLAYLVMMTARLVELHRVLKPTGSLYLHCDPTASHYLKLILDAIFGPDKFRNEVVWKRTTAHSSANRYGPIHDVLLFYSRSDSFTWNPQYQPYDEKYLKSKYRYVEEGSERVYRLSDLTANGTRNGSSGQPWRGFDPRAKGNHWKFTTERLDELDEEGRIYWTKGGAGFPQFKRYLDEMPGIALQDVWTDIDPINARAAERLGYPTQKPLSLLERVVSASSNPGDTVLDPFCGCGTTIDAAQALDRRWVGIDISYLSVALIQERLVNRYGPEIAASFNVTGIPRDLAGAEALFRANAFDFERWAVTAVGGRANERQVGDKGSDGVIRFPLDKKNVGRIIVSVKGGATVNPAMVRDLRGTVEREKAEMGVLITLTAPTKGMMDEVHASGRYTYELTGTEYPRLQTITISELLAGKRLDCPSFFPAYTQAKRVIDPLDQTSLPI